MQPHLEIEFGHLPPNGAAEAAAREGAARLRQACSRVGSCHVTLAGPADGHHLGQALCVQVRLHVPGATLSVSQPQQCGETPETTVRQAFAAAQRRLLDWLAAGGEAAAAEGTRQPPPDSTATARPAP